MESYKGDIAVRLYAGEVHKDDIVTPKGKAYTLISLPYYLTGKIGDYLK